MNDEYSAFLGKMVEAQTTAGRLARSAIARHLPFVMSVDEDWAIERVVPLFRLGDKIDRRAVWDGFLYGRIDFRVAGILQDTFLEAAKSLDELFADESEPRRLFIKAFAAMLAYFVDEPLTSWIPAFFSKAAADDGQQLAWDLGDVIGDMEDAQQQELCQRWLNQYWENRLGGIPAQLTPEEAGAMLEWLPHFHSVFPNAVNLAVQMNNPTLEHGFIVRRLNEGETPQLYPEATAKLLVYLENWELPPWEWHGSEELVERLFQGSMSQNLKAELQEISAKLGLNVGL